MKGRAYGAAFAELFPAYGPGISVWIFALYLSAVSVDLVDRVLFL